MCALPVTSLIMSISRAQTSIQTRQPCHDTRRQIGCPVKGSLQKAGFAIPQDFIEPMAKP
jgi:hypothetical protein